VKYLYLAGGCLVVAQVLGIYALVSRKADLVFSITMVVLVVLAAAMGYEGLRQVGVL
jgi:hypothetical protein